MALTRDFLMNMIEKLAAAFFQIIAGKAIEAPEQALVDIEDLLAEALGMGRDFVLGSGPLALENVEPALAAQLARLLLLHARLSEEIGDPQRAQRARQMGFRAIERALERPATEYARLAALQLREHLDTLAANVGADELAQACIGAHTAAVEARAWGDAEDWLFFALDASPGAQFAAIGRDFYARLLSLPPGELEEGGLTPDEVRESAEELSRY